jgi:hypothetical protein
MKILPVYIFTIMVTFFNMTKICVIYTNKNPYPNLPPEGKEFLDHFPLGGKRKGVKFL